jgi:uncharacterized glyoxalase superfamily protein PhnB
VEDPYRRPPISPSLIYKDPWAALDWLEKAFGFERTMVITDKDGTLGHSEMRLGEALIYVGREWSSEMASPAGLGGKNTQTIHLHIKDGIDAHCAHAKAAGAEILMEPQDQFYGDRTYRARDCEGHIWSFGQAVRYVTREEAEKASGYKIEGWA